MLETTLIRVGNREFARTNRSYGLTTLRGRHVVIEGDRLRFQFRGKSGNEIEVSVRDRRLARILRQIQELPGQELFQYIDDEGDRQAVHSDDINQYLRELTDESFTAKDFRTFAATVMVAWMQHEFAEVDSQAAAKRNIAKAIAKVASRHGNTVAICRKSYIHPEILNAYLDGCLLDRLRGEIDHTLRQNLPGLMPEEAAVLALLRQRLTGEPDQSV